MKYIWWHGKDLQDFFALVGKKGAENVRIKLDLEGEKPLLYVIEDGKDMREKNGATPYNFAHTCPPDCGNGG